MDRIRVSTDGAQNSLSEAGGWGVVIREDDTLRTFSGAARETTNNRMELRAILEGLREMSDGASVLVRSDSEYALNVARGDWTAKANRDLVDAIHEEAERVEVEWTWVEGHAGDPDNERADDLAEGEAATMHERVMDGESVYVVEGNTYPHRKEIGTHGLRWSPERGAFVTTDREAWESAIDATGAEQTGKHTARIS
jgi:ribonuclease HI